MAKLKVYVTPIGFHNAYVAAPSQQAALQAWGAKANLFARGVAEIVIDPKLTAEPLARPGEVVKIARGSAAEHIAALPKTKRARTATAPEKPEPRSKPKPRPSRAKLDAAEQALATLTDRHERARATLEKTQATELAKVEAVRDKAQDAYREALEKWDG